MSTTAATGAVQEPGAAVDAPHAAARTPRQGWRETLVPLAGYAVLFTSGVQLLTVGILGRYMARVHAEVLARPLYLVDWVQRPGADAPADGQPTLHENAPVPR